MARAKKSAARKRRARRIVTHAARVAAEELAAVDGEEIEDPENPFGEDDEPSIMNAPPLPPMMGEKPAPPPKSIVDLGSPPEDPLAAQAWLHKVLIASAADAAIDPDISAKERRRELRTISAAAAKLVPDVRRYEAEQTVLRARKSLEAKVRAKQGAKLRPIPGLTSIPPATGEPDA